MIDADKLYLATYFLCQQGYKEQFRTTRGKYNSLTVTRFDWGVVSLLCGEGTQRFNVVMRDGGRFSVGFVPDHIGQCHLQGSDEVLVEARLRGII